MKAKDENNKPIPTGKLPGNAHQRRKARRAKIVRPKKDQEVKV
jgi:hypothetical protein